MIKVDRFIGKKEPTWSVLAFIFAILSHRNRIMNKVKLQFNKSLLYFSTTFVKVVYKFSLKGFRRTAVLIHIKLYINIRDDYIDKNTFNIEACINLLHD